MRDSLTPLRNARRKWSKFKAGSAGVSSLLSEERTKASLDVGAAIHTAQEVGLLTGRYYASVTIAGVTMSTDEYAAADLKEILQSRSELALKPRRDAFSEKGLTTKRKNDKK